MPETGPASSFVCPCGSPVADGLPAPGHRPVPCVNCRAPLVAPGDVGDLDVARALGVGLIAAVAAAAGWMYAARALGSGTPWAIPVGAAAVSFAVREAARVRSPAVRAVAIAAFAAFLGVGETLLYRRALLPRLTAMHAAEGAVSPDILARQEQAGMDWLEYASLETSQMWFLAVAVAVAIVLRVTRPYAAVAAFPAQSRAAATNADPGPSSGDAPATPA